MTIKSFRFLCLCFPALFFLAGCSTNPATGEKQFTALMSPAQENQIGAQEHAKVLAQYGTYNEFGLQDYVREIGRKVVANTERGDVAYQFYLLDDPMVNAFALPGGFIYTTRGLLALAGSEAELAAVLGHEAGHITGRHTAERYSRSVVTSLGASIIAQAVGQEAISQALSVGSNLYLSAYSRGQERQADMLGIRYSARAGYMPAGMTSFLASLQADTSLQAKIAGNISAGQFDYFSTHPATQERVADTRAQAMQYSQTGIVNREAYIKRIRGLVYGESASQGFIRGRDFYHTQMGFGFRVPDGYEILNQPEAVIARGKSGAIAIFDIAPNKGQIEPMRFLRDIWMQGEGGHKFEEISVNGLRAATASIQGRVNGQMMTIQLVAIAWGSEQIARFMVGLPPNIGKAELDGLKAMTYSFKALSPAEKNSIQPHRIDMVVAKTGDTVKSLAAQMVFEDFREERFRVLNGLGPSGNVSPGEVYKIVR